MRRWARPSWLLAELIALSAVVRAIAAWRIDGLWIMPDEVIYASLGRSLYEHGRLAILDGPSVPYSLVYPALVGLPFSVASLQRAIDTLKLVQPLLMSLTAVPVYLWGRSLMPPRWALLAAGLTLAVPGLLYSGLLMTHVAYYPIATLAVWAIARALERETSGAQALAVGAVLLALATRLQAVVFVPALITAVGLKALLDRRPGTIARFAPGATMLGGLLAVWGGYRLVVGGHWSAGLGPYAAAAGQGYDLGNVARFVGYHLGAIVLVSGIVPVCAVTLLAIDAVLGRERSAAVRAFVAITISYAAWEIVEVGAFASENADALLERDLLTLLPPLFLGFALWLARGAERPFLKSALVAIAALAPLVSMPFADLVGAAALPDSFTLAPLFDLQRHSTLDLGLVVTVVGAAVAGLFVLVPRRFALLLPAIVLVWLVGASASATREVTSRVRVEQRLVGAPERSWIDKSVHSDAAYVFDGESYWNGVWQEVFWNEKLRRIYDLSETSVPGPLPQTHLSPQSDGQLVGSDGAQASERFAVATAEHTFFGSPIAMLPQQDVDTRGLTLWRLDQPLRLSTVLRGVKPNGDMVEPARMVVYDCRGGQLRLTLLPKGSDTVEIFRDGKQVRTLEFHGEPSWSGTIPARPSAEPRICTFDVAGSGLLGSTVFQFER